MRTAVHQALDLFFTGIHAVRPDRLITPAWVREHLPTERARRLFVVGAGKAAMAMAGVLEDVLPRPVERGLAVVPHGYPATYPLDLPPPQVVEIRVGGHPVPDRDSVAAGVATARLLDEAGEGDLVIVLLSGGGSALLTLPPPGISLEDVQQLVQALIRSGATIQEINTVRRHLDALKGGKLALRAYPARVHTLILSDVVGNDLEAVASGPTVPDPTTFADAIAVLRRYDLWKDAPETIRNFLTEGTRRPEWENPKPGNPIFRRVHNHLIGDNRLALEAMRRRALEMGFEAFIQTSALTGEARQVGPRLVQEMQEAVERGVPTCLLWGGETTVTVRGSGRGGRNQELVLSAVPHLHGHPHALILLSGATDGLDGPTDAAGAWANTHTLTVARERHLDPEAFLANNDSYTFFHRLGQLIRTGPTHTNVMDLQVGLVFPDPAGV